MKKFMKLLSVFLALVLFMEAIPLWAIENEPYNFETVNEIPADEFFNTAPPEEETEAVENVEAEVVGELTEKREGNVKHFRMSDGSVKAAIYPYDVHFENENGEFEEIDNSLSESEDEGEGVYSNKSNSFFVKFKKKANSNILYTLEIDGHKIKASIEGADKSEAKLAGEDESEEKLTGAPMAVENLSGSVTYKNIFKNTDIQYTVISDRLKENIIINKKVNFGSLTYHYDIGNDLEAVEEEDGTILIREKESEETVTVISAPTMWDAAGRHSSELSLELTEQNNGKITVVLTWDKEWVDSKETTFPVTVDPIIETTEDPYLIEDTYVTSADPNNSEDRHLWEHVRVAKTAYTLIKFPLPELKSGDKVINAELCLAPYFAADASRPQYSNANDFSPRVNITAHRIKQSWTTENITYNNLPSSFYDTTVEDYTPVDGDGHFYTWNVTKLVDGWYNGTANNGVFLKFDKDPPDAAFDAFFLSSDGNWTSPDYYPQIIVQYINTTGIESYYSAHVQSVGKAGVVYTNDMTGNLTLINDIVTVGSGNAPITVSLVYNSNDVDEDIWCGHGWRLNWTQSIKETALTLTKDGTELKYYMYKDGDGTEHYFLQDSSGSMNATDEIHSTRKITYNSSTYDYVMSDDSGAKLYFKKRSGHAEWYLYKSEDVNGNTVTLTLNSSNPNKITKIESSSGYAVNMSYSTDGYLIELSYNYEKTTQTVVLSYSNPSNYATSNACISDVIFPGHYVVSYYYDEAAVSTPEKNRYILKVDDNGKYSVSYTYQKGGTTSPMRVKKITEKAGNSAGQWAEMTYGLCSNTIKDGTSGRSYLYTFSHTGTLKSVVDMTSGDGNGYGQYYEYNKGKEETKGKGDLTFVSKTQKSTVNLLANHSFESDTEFTQLKWDNSGGNATMSYSTTKKMIGNRSMKLYKPDNNCSSVLGYKSVTLTEGVTYTLSAYVNTSEMNASTAGSTERKGVRLLAYYSDSIYYQTEYFTEITGSDEWKRISVTFTPDTTLTYKICLALTRTTGTVYYDCVQLEVGGLSDYNLLEDAGFELNSLEWKHSEGNTSAITTAVKLTGSKSLAMTSNPDSRNDFVQYVKVNGKKGDSFVLSAFAKTYSPSFDKNSTAEKWRLTLLVRFYDSSGNSINDCNIHFNPDTDSWQKVAGAVVAKADYSSLSVWLLHYNNVNTVYFDNVQLVKDTFGNTYTYDDKGNVVSTTDLEGKSEYTFTYDGSSQLVKETNITGSKLFYAYSPSKKQQLVSVTGAGVTASYAYESNGNAAISKTTAYEIIDGESYYIRNYYTGEYLTVKNSGTTSGTNVTGEEFKGNSSQKWTLKKTSGDIYRLSPACASSLYLASDSTTLANGTNVSVRSSGTYSYFKIVTSSYGGTYTLKFSNGSTADGSYYLTVKSGNAEAKTYHDGHDIRYVFIPCASVSTKTGHEAIYSGATYDSKGNVTSQTDSLGNTTGYTYLYDRGLVDSTVNAEGSKTYYTYNTNDQTTGITFEGGALTRSASYTYNTNRLLQKITSPGGTVYNFTYDSFFRNTATTIGTSETPITLITNTYDNRDRLTKSIYGNGTTVENTYDALDRLASVKINDTKRYEYLYDGVGRIAETRDLAIDKIVKYDYDLLDRLTKTSIIEDRSVSGQAATMQDKYIIGELSTEYDSVNRVSKTIAAFGNKTLTTQFGYTRRDYHVIENVKFNGSAAITYAYDKLGRVSDKTVGGINVSYEYLDGARLRNDDFTPSYSEGRCFFGDFNGDGYIDACVISNLSGYYKIYVWEGKADGTFKPYVTAANITGNAEEFTGNVVVGNFLREPDGTAQRDEIAVLSRDSANYPVLYVLKKTSSSSFGFERSLWYTGEEIYSLDPTNVKNRMAAGDFDNDGQDEIAMLYAYTSSMSLLVFDTEYATGSNLIDWDSRLNVASGDCNAEKITGRMVAGNFDGAGGDDVAFLYDTDNVGGKLKVFRSTGENDFSSPETWYTFAAGVFDPARVTGTLTAGDFTGDGKDDLAMVYNYETTANVFVFTSKGTSFNKWTEWHQGKGNYQQSKLKGRIATIDNGENKADSLIALYPESDSGYAIYRWDKKTSSSSFELNNNLHSTWNSEYYGDTHKATSTVVKSETFDECETYEYTYDSLGNVTSVTLVLDSGDTNERTLLKEYTYDALGQLITEDVKDKYITEYTYDNGGNIVSKYTREYVMGTPYYQGTTTNYTYGNTQWKDLLTSFNGENISYDEIGNPETYIGGAELTWTDGRRLAAFSKTGLSMSFEYDMDGIRQTKTVNGQKTKYFTSGSTILRETRPDGKNLYFYYDDLGNIAALEYNGAMYYYIRNILGEIMALSNSSGEFVAFYQYDAYGAPLSVTNEDGEDVSNDPTSIAYINPYRYKGYYYDVETEFYYLNSRYYNPMTARFINADGYVSTGQGILGYNMFAYCGNNPILYLDLAGTRYCEAMSVNDESVYDRFYSCYWQRQVVLEKYNPAPIGRTDQGNVYLVKNASDVRTEFLSDIIVVDNRNETKDGNVEIQNSFHITDKKIQYQTLEILIEYEKSNPTGWTRTVDSMMIEWEIHNEGCLLGNYFPGLGKLYKHSRHACFDNNSEGWSKWEHYKDGIRKLLT